MVARRQGTDPATLERHFGPHGDLLDLWIAEPSVDLAPAVVEALKQRAAEGWYGYETRPGSLVEAFWRWAADRHGWDGAGLHTLVSPSVGTSIGVLIDSLTEPGHGVILQPPVFTDFKPLIAAHDRAVVRNPLALTADGYRLDLDDLEAKASDPRNRMLILCNPHNPVGRVWTRQELERVATICAEHDVFVLADEIHADLALAPHAFVPFGVAAAGREVAWAATHGPIKTFGLAGVCDTLLITAGETVADRFEQRSSQFHLTRNNVFGLAAFEAVYAHGAVWLDDFLELVAANVRRLQDGLPDTVDLVAIEGTYLAWLRPPPARARRARHPHVARFGGSRTQSRPLVRREGAGFARMTIAAPGEIIEEAVGRLVDAAGDQAVDGR